MASPSGEHSEPVAAQRLCRLGGGPIIETIRSSLAGHPAGGSAAQTVAWCLGLLAVGVAGSVVAFRRRTA